MIKLTASNSNLTVTLYTGMNKSECLCKRLSSDGRSELFCAQLLCLGIFPCGSSVGIDLCCMVRRV